MKDTTEPTITEHGDETHPAWATIGAYRGSQNPGATLFDSDIRHQNTMTIRLFAASRKRNVNSDWIHGGDTLVEVQMSEAQWASFVSATNSGSGVPCTLRYTKGGGHTPNFPHEPRLALTMAETHKAAQSAFEDIQAAFAEVESLISGGTAKQKRDALSTLRARINNAVPNVDFAGKHLIEHAEDVVQKSKADVEAFVVRKAHQLGIAPGEIHALTSGRDEE